MVFGLHIWSTAPTPRLRILDASPPSHEMAVAGRKDSDGCCGESFKRQQMQNSFVAKSL